MNLGSRNKYEAKNFDDSNDGAMGEYGFGKNENSRIFCFMFYNTSYNSKKLKQQGQRI